MSVDFTEKTQHQIIRIEHQEHLMAQFGRLVERAPNIGLDFETALITDEDPFPKPRLLALSRPEMTLLIDLWKVDPAPIWETLAARRLLGHNLHFDLGVAQKHYGFFAGKVHDSQLLELVLDSGVHAWYTKDYYGLDDCVRRHLGWEMPKDPALRLTFGETPELTAAHWRYAAQDVIVSHWLQERQAEALRLEGLWKTAVIENQMLPGVVWMRQNGMPINREAWLALSQDAEAKAAKLAEQLNAIAPVKEVDPGKRHAKMMSGGVQGVLMDMGDEDIAGYSVDARTGERISNRPAWDWNSTVEVSEAFARAGVVLADTTDVTLAFCEHPMAALLREYRGEFKAASTYGEGWFFDRKHVNRFQDGWVRGDWLQNGTRAGRMSAMNPNLQNLKRDPRYRACFEAPEGWSVVKVDLSQIELRACAWVTGDRNMRRAYFRGEDIHSVTAALISGKTQDGCDPVEWKKLRQDAKPVNFGLIYMMSAAGLRRTAAADYGIFLPEEQAAAYKTRYFAVPDGFWGVQRWHWKLCHDRDPETRTSIGRRRFILEDTEYDQGRANTRRANTPIQGTAADILKDAFGKMYHRRHEMPGFMPIAMVHDEVVALMPEDRAEDCGQWMRQIMIEAGTPMIAPVPVDADWQVGRTWAGEEWEKKQAVDAEKRQMALMKLAA